MNTADFHARSDNDAKMPANLEALIDDEMRLWDNLGASITWTQARENVERRIWTWWEIEDKKKADPKGSA